MCTALLMLLHFIARRYEKIPRSQDSIARRVVDGLDTFKGWMRVLEKEVLHSVSEQ